MSVSQIIVTSRYIRSGTKKSKTKRANYTKYIATRETVEKRPQNNNQASLNQTQLLNDLLTEFPKAKTYLEYEDYKASPTMDNASELISTIVERHADVLGNRRNFVGYMAMRPGAERRGEHGLFNDKDDPIDLNAVADEIASHPGNVWTHVISLRREDAVRLGYTNSDMWRELVKRHIADIAKAQNISLTNLKWYAAYHDTTHHPHIHMIVYSTNPKQGYLTNEGINKIRSVFANDLFQDELKSIYQQQTMTRDELKVLSEDQMKDIMEQIDSGDVNEQLLSSIQKLHDQLMTVSGKKVYGYLPKDIKKTVDDIFSMLSQNEHIREMYEKWCELESLKHKTYTLKPKAFPPLTENKEFRSVKNMIIRTVMKMEDSFSYEQEPSILDPTDSDYISQNDFVDEWIPYDDIKARRCMAEKYIKGESVDQDIDKGIEMLTNLANNGDMLSAYKLGKMYLEGKVVLRDLDKAERYLRQAADDNNEYAMYVLAKLYLTDEKYDISNAVDLLEKAYACDIIRPYAAYVYAKILLDNNEYHDTNKAIKLLEENVSENNWCSYLLGKIYLFGNKIIEPDKTRAVEILTQSAKDGNEYAESLIQHIDDHEQALQKNLAMNLFINVARIIEVDYDRNQRKILSKVDKKLRGIIRKKKEELGIKSDEIDIRYDY